MQTRQDIWQQIFAQTAIAEANKGYAKSGVNGK